ncbi:sensor histidine kinase [Polaribacter staleyi]|uniref:sensor histidine kinase n=1 Tax=Polaribacter staleyi TaxID=2022337 RepID=UPI0031BB7C90
MLKLHISLLLIMLWGFSFSQQYTNITVKEGLPSNHVYKIIQDTQGFIWFATDKGLVKYNGNTLKSFTTRNGLSTNDVWGIHPTPDGKLWYLSKTSKLGYIKNDSVYAFESEVKNEIFSPNYTSQVGNKIILTSNSRTHHLENNKWKLLLGNNSPKNKSKIYIHHPLVSYLKNTPTLDSVEIIYKSGKIKEISGLKKITNPINRGQITDSLFYWVGDKEYSILNLNTSKVYNRNYKDEIQLEKSKYARINLINNQIQITGKGFVGVLDANYHITKTVLIPKKFDAHFAMIDKNETLWIASFLNGLYKLTKTKATIKYLFDHQNVAKINNINGNIIANVSNHGFFKYNVNTKQFLPYIDEKEHLFSATYIDSLKTEFYISKNKIKLIKNNTKATKLDFTKPPFYTNETARNLVYFNAFLYGNFTGGINKIDPQNKLNILNSYKQRGITKLIIFNNQLLIATTNGLKQFKNEEIKEVTFNGLKFNKSILSINKISNSQLLLNTDGFGSFITDLKDIYPLPKSDFLIVNNAFVENKTIWLATNSGVYKYALSENNYHLEKKLLLPNGLPSLQVNDVFIVKNDLIVSTNNGIAILPKNKKNTNHLLDIYIDKLSYNNHLIKQHNNTFKYIDNNNINISVSSLDFSEGNENLSYQYKLAPLQNNWKNTETTNINFNDLQPNKYTFTIKARNFQKKTEFTILPLWYQTIWFKAVVVLLLISVFFRTVWYLSKRKQLQKNEKHLQEKQLSEIQLKALRSQMNPHFVFNSLAAIQYFINENDFATSEKYLVKFSKLIRRFFELSKENTITLSEEIKLLTNYLEIEKLRFREKLEFKISIEDKVDFNKTKIPTMLLQPIVENAVNHGIFNKFNTGTVTISFTKITPKTYKVLIIDDGVGFVNTKSKNKKIKSSNVLQQRLSYLNASEEWEIQYFTEELYPEKEERGNKSTFIIKNK